MINPFTIQSKISKLQQEVLRPLYTMHPEQGSVHYDWLLVLTGRVIDNNRSFLEDLAKSKMVAAVFKIVKLLGGADSLTQDDFDRFTAYINDGGLRAMVKMLLAADKEKVFLEELRSLPPHVRKNAPKMLEKSVILHREFIEEYLQEQYGSPQAVPQPLRTNVNQSTQFISRLASLAKTVT